MRGQPDGLLCVCVFEGSCEAVFGLDRGAMWGHDGPMPAETSRPKIPAYRCSEHVDWPLGQMEHVVVDHGEVLHVVPGRSTSYGIYDEAVAAGVAEELADRLDPKAIAEELADRLDPPTHLPAKFPIGQAWRADPDGTYWKVVALADELHASGTLTRKQCEQMKNAAAKENVKAATQASAS